ncbi:hypothetical protein [Enterocloster bolteae]|nr:hypothetical protein [Enterocloster bolteae]
MKRKLCLALSAVMLAGSLSGCSGGDQRTAGRYVQGFGGSGR